MEMFLGIWIAVSVLGTLVNAQLTRPEGCGTDLGCYHDCEGDTCSYLVTWSDEDDVIAFSLSLATSGVGNKWIALGLSTDKNMGSDSVTDCVVFDGSITVQKSYNVDVGSDNTVLNNPSEGFTTGETSLENNVLTCRYSQSKTSTNNQIFNLDTDWYLLVATGNSGGVGRASKSPHSLADLPAISPRKADFQSNDDITGTAKDAIIKVHGSFMMFAWIFCASIGIVLARFFKNAWPNKTLCNDKIWFVFHRILMVSAFLFCVTAFILIFADVKDWSHLHGSSTWQKAHPYLGVIVTALCMLNPAMAIFRPHPDGKNRSLFNWAHWAVGTSAHILSALTIILGVTLGRSSAPFYLVWVLTAWLLYQVCVVLMLESLSCCYPTKTGYYDVDSRKSPRDNTVKMALLVFHVLIITGFTVACIVILNVN